MWPAVVVIVEPEGQFAASIREACKTCPQQGVMAAPLPDRIIDQSLVSDEVIINTVVNKYCDHAPL